VDRYYDKNMHQDEDKTTDSIWNFHVWNDVWIRRPDLPEGHGGWQAIDATPQELSDKLYQTDPCPLVSIKNGEKGVNYDLEFIFSEVNADIRTWVENDKGGYDLMSVETRGVGSLMATKAINRNALQNVVDDYKYPEGSLGERAVHGGEKGENEKGDVEFKFDVSNTKIGEDFVVKVGFKHRSGGQATAKLRLVATVIAYHDSERADVKDIQEDIKIGGSDSSKTYALKFSEYGAHLKDDITISFKLFVMVAGNKQSYFEEVRVNFDLPVLRFELLRPSQLSLDADGVVRVSFINPLPIALTKVKLTVEGQSLTKLQGFDLPDIPPKGKFSQNVNIHGWDKDAHFLIGALITNELAGVRGQIELFVE